MSDISQRYEFALQQVVAESYLDKIELNAVTERSLDEVIKRLTNGNNHYSLPEDKFTGATRMTPSQAHDFLNHYEIIDQLPNTESGFSATLMRSKLDNPQAGIRKKNATPYSAANIAQFAKENTDEGLAWRYTLKNQTPFVVTGVTSIYNVHNQHRQLNLHDAATGKGMTSQEIDTLARKLEHQIHLNVHDTKELENTVPTSLKHLLSETMTPKFNNNDLTLPGLSVHARNVDLFLANSGRPSVALEVIQQQIAMRLAMQEKIGVDLPAYLLETQENKITHPHLG